MDKSKVIYQILLWTGFNVGLLLIVPIYYLIKELNDFENRIYLLVDVITIIMLMMESYYFFKIFESKFPRLCTIIFSWIALIFGNLHAYSSINENPTLKTFLIFLMCICIFCYIWILSHNNDHSDICSFCPKCYKHICNDRIKCKKCQTQLIRCNIGIAFTKLHNYFSNIFKFILNFIYYFVIGISLVSIIYCAIDMIKFGIEPLILLLTSLITEYLMLQKQINILFITNNESKSKLLYLFVPYIAQSSFVYFLSFLILNKIYKFSLGYILFLDFIISVNVFSNVLACACAFLIQ